jgi:hypothetical protein
VEILYNTLQKVSSNAVSVRKAIQHFEVAPNVIRGNPPQVNGNPEPSTKRAPKDHNINAEANEVCGAIVTQMKHRFEEESHTLPFALIEPQLFMAHKERFPSELVGNVVKYYPMLSKDKLESELSVVYRNDTFADVKSVFVLWNLVKEHNLENTLSEVHKLVEIALSSGNSTNNTSFNRGVRTLFWYSKIVKTYLRISIGQERLNFLAILRIHKDVIAYTPRFSQKVIELFASQKN